MGTQKNFYEDYWKLRKKEGRIHVREGMWVPRRVSVAVDMIAESQDADLRKGFLSVLDVGCGEGVFGKILRQRLGDGVFVVGCDISLTALKIAHPFYSLVCEVDIESEGIGNTFRERSFDYIVVLEVLEHLFDPGAALCRIHRLLKDDGFLIASFPNIAWYRYRIEFLKGKFPDTHLLHPGEHLQNFTLSSFCELLRKSGFVPVKIDGKFSGPKIFRPKKIFKHFFRMFPGLFGRQIVIKSKKV